jgi:hypothetical protein
MVKNLIARRKACLALNFLTILCTPIWCDYLLAKTHLFFPFELVEGHLDFEHPVVMLRTDETNEKLHSGHCT